MPKLVLFYYITKIIIDNYNYKIFKIIKILISNFVFRFIITTIDGESDFENILND